MPRYAPSFLALSVALFCVSAAASAGTVHSKAGATAEVSNKYVRLFQTYVRKLEAAGATIRFMGGYRHEPQGCSIPRHKHPCGLALDVCQLSRGRVSPDCHLPKPRRIIGIARSVGLNEGASWKRSDYGHAEVPTGRRHIGKRSRRWHLSRYAR